MGDILLKFKERAYHLAQNPSSVEVLMIAKLDYSGIRYKFQCVVLGGGNFYIVDFFIAKLNLIVEIDESSIIQHDDELRDRHLRQQKYQIIHIKEEDVDTFNTLSLIDYKPISKRIKEGKQLTSLEKQAKSAKAFFDKIERNKYGKK